MEGLFEFEGMERIAVCTLTFAEHLSAPAAQKRLNSFLNWIREHFAGFVWVRQRTAAGRIHFHMLVLCHEDIWTGSAVNDLLNTQKSRRMEKLHLFSPAARSVAEIFLSAAKTHGFGIADCLPVLTNGEGVRAYLTKEVRQQWYHRHWLEETHTRWWDISRSLRRVTSRVSCNSPDHRRNCEEFCSVVGCANEDQLRVVVGSRYAYYVMQWVSEGRPPVTSVMSRIARERVELLREEGFAAVVEGIKNNIFGKGRRRRRRKLKSLFKPHSSGETQFPVLLSNPHPLAA